MASPVAVFFPEVKAIGEALKDFPKSTRKKYFRAAFTAAAKVGQAKLKQITPRGPTGNLKRSVKTKSTPNYGLAGYAAARGEKAKGYHQGFLEFGTKERRVRFPSANGFIIASSFMSRQAFRFTRKALVRGARKVQNTSPKYPKAFFKAAPKGSILTIPKMPVGGRLGRPPVKTAFQQSQSTMAGVLRTQASTAYERASKDLARKFPPKGTT